VRTFSRSSQFKKDIKRQARRGKDMVRLKAVMDALIDEQPLPPQSRDHRLRGEWIGSRDCHVESDWVLIYTLEASHVRFERTGTHSDLFE
jgi:mRNA interferase YafQ